MQSKRIITQIYRIKKLQIKSVISILQLNEFLGFSSIVETMKMFVSVSNLKPTDLECVLEAGPQVNTFQIKHTLKSNFPMQSL